MTAFAWLLALTVRSTVVLSVALALGVLLRRTAAVARHRVLTVTAIGLLLLPALPGMLPRWEIERARPWVETQTTITNSPTARPSVIVPLVVSGERASLPATRPAVSLGSVASAVVSVWLFGVGASLLALARALRRERRLLAGSRPLAGAWLETLDDARRALALSRPVRLLTCDAIETPLTGGWPATVLLPPSAELWPEERRQVVVQHELAHVVHCDALRQLAWRLVAALYWFHPLARVAQRHAKLVGEHACDETVVRLGTRPSTYARHLLEIAESLRAQPPAFASALPMVDRSQLERRLHMILDPKSPAGRGRAATAVCVVLLTATVLGVGAAAPPGPREKTSRVTSRSNDDSSEFDQQGDDSFTLRRSLGNGRRLSAHVSGPVRFDERGGISDLGSGSVLIETRGARRSQRMLITAEEGKPRYQWWVDGATHAVDDAARAWLAEALEVVATARAIGTIQGHVGSLQGAIGAIQGEIGALQGEIGGVQGEVGSLQGKVGSIQGDQGSLQGTIGSHQGAIGGLEAARAQASAALQKQIDGEIRQHEAAIAKVQAELASGAFARRMQAAEAELKAAEVRARDQIAELERKMKSVHAEDRIGKLQREIEAMHADERIKELERRLEPALERLKGRIDGPGPESRVLENLFPRAVLEGTWPARAGEDKDC
jgi:beta-lactamase regulating signal transducer with metallopeptidase domain/predicted  nucleic acid-binding Zn-ribbon protein